MLAPMGQTIAANHRSHQPLGTIVSKQRDYSKRQRLRSPARYKALEARPFSTPPNLAIYTVYNLSRYFTTVSIFSPTYLGYMKHIHHFFLLLDSSFPSSGVSGTKYRSFFRIGPAFRFSRIPPSLGLIIERTQVGIIYSIITEFLLEDPLALLSIYIFQYGNKKIRLMPFLHQKWTFLNKQFSALLI